MLDTVVMSGDDVCCSVVFGTLVGVFVFSVMWSELLMTSAISCPLLLCLHQLPPQIYRIDLLVFSSIVQTYRYWSDQVCLTGHCQYSQNIH